MSEKAPTPEKEAPEVEPGVESPPATTEPVVVEPSEADKTKAAAVSDRLNNNSTPVKRPRIFTPTGTNTLQKKPDDGHDHHKGFLRTWAWDQPSAIFMYFFTLIGRGLKSLPSMAGKGGGKSSGGDHGGGGGGHH